MRKVLVLIFISFVINAHTYAQNNFQSLKFGYSIGVNSLKYGKAESLSLGGSSYIIGDYPTKRKYFHLIGGLGISYLNASSYRKISGQKGLWGDPFTEESEIEQEYLCIDIPVKVMALLANEQMYRNKKVVPFAEFGLHIQFPLSNNSSYWHYEKTTGSWSGETTENLYEGKLELAKLAPSIGLGLLVASKYKLILNGAILVCTSKNNDPVLFLSGLAQLSFCYFHNGLIGR